MFSFWLYQKACRAQKIEETTLSIISISSVHLDKNISFFQKESQKILMQKFLRLPSQYSEQARYERICTQIQLVGI